MKIKEFTDTSHDENGYRIPRAHRTEVGCAECGSYKDLEPCGSMILNDPICKSCRKKRGYKPCRGPYHGGEARCPVNHIAGICPESSYVKESFPAQRNAENDANMKAFKDGMEFPLTIYRALDVPPDQVNMDNLGSCWATNENNAWVYFGNHKIQNPTILRAEVLEDDIDWEETYYQNIRYGWGETEVYIKKDAGIYLTGIKHGSDIWIIPQGGRQYVFASRIPRTNNRITESQSTELFTFITESKVLRNERDVQKYTVKELGEILFSMMLALHIIGITDESRKYCLKSLAFPKFDHIFLSSTDLSNCISSLRNARKYLNQPNVDVPMNELKRYLRGVIQKNNTNTFSRAFFMRLQTKLKIKSADLLILRREIVDGETVRDKEKLADKLYQNLRNYNNCDILALLQTVLDDSLT